MNTICNYDVSIKCNIINVVMDDKRMNGVMYNRWKDEWCNVQQMEG